jgi:hypothetical protein
MPYFWSEEGFLVVTSLNVMRALVNAVMTLRVPYSAGKFLIGCTTGGLSSSAQPRNVRRRAV